jgi:hypothetical protein
MIKNHFDVDDERFIRLFRSCQIHAASGVGMATKTYIFIESCNPILLATYA